MPYFLVFDLRLDPACPPNSARAFDLCLVDFLGEDLVAAVASNSPACCSVSKAADALAALFRKGAGDRPAPG